MERDDGRASRGGTRRDATLDATAALVAERGLTSLTMSQIAERAGIGRATLYKYFPDVEAIITAWHERQIAGHLDQLATIADQADTPSVRLEAVLRTYALIQHKTHGHHGSELTALLHQGEHVAQAHRRLHGFVRDLLTEAVQAGELRDDVNAGELAHYCLHALTAAGNLASRTAVQRLVAVTMAGLRPES